MGGGGVGEPGCAGVGGVGGVGVEVVGVGCVPAVWMRGWLAVGRLLGREDEGGKGSGRLLVFCAEFAGVETGWGGGWGHVCGRGGEGGGLVEV